MTGQIKTFKAGKKSYNLVQATAVNQKELLLLVGGMISMRSAATRSRIDTDFLRGALLSLDSAKLDRVADIVLTQGVEAGGQIGIDVASFQGRIFSYVELVAQGVAFNLDDFFTYLNETVDELERKSK